jgi:CDGSH-type Zn-finger protein
VQCILSLSRKRLKSYETSFRKDGGRIMSRLVKISEQAPVEVKVGSEGKWICACGLSKNKPFCDGSHQKTKDEDPKKTYVYDKDNRVEI